jgi:Protein of unknown function (DUF1344)
MRKRAAVTLLALLMVGTPVYAQMADQPSQPGGSGEMMLTTGTITEVDLAGGTLTLDNGTQFTLPPLFQYTSFPTLGQEVAVIYVEEGGQNVARSIDVGRGGSE